MSKTLIVFGSTNGSTECVGDDIARILVKNGHGVTILSAADVVVEHMADGYDCVFLGCSGRSGEDSELQEDFIPVFENLEKAELKGKRVAVFGCGDASHRFFCGAVDAIAAKSEQLGAVLLGHSLKIDGDPDPGEVGAWMESTMGSL